MIRLLVCQYSKQHLVATHLLVLTVLFSLSACGGRQGREGEGRGVEDGLIVATGKISARGSTPFSMVMLEASDGKIYLVQSSPLGDELRNLVGMDVSVTATVSRKEGFDEPVIDVVSYDLLALPSGEVPIVGVVRPGGWLEDDTMVTWVLEGDFSELLKTFVGSKVWIVGVKQRWVNNAQGSYRVIDVTEYGVIRR